MEAEASADGVKEEEVAEAPGGDPEIEEMQRKVLEMEEEAENLKKLTEEMDDSTTGADTAEVDRRSVYVGNVDYGAVPEELQEHFKSCGGINRITILVNKFTGSPKGFAYIEFGDEQGVQNSLLLNDSLFRGRQLKVIQKRTNIPGMAKGKGKKGKDKGKGKGKKGKKGKGKGKYSYGYAPRYYRPSYYSPY